MWSVIEMSGAEALLLLDEARPLASIRSGADEDVVLPYFEAPEFARLARSMPVRSPLQGQGLPQPKGRLSTTFLQGPIQFFLVDMQSFAGTEPAGPSGEGPTLLGAAQWDWLEQALVGSQAPFKVVAPATGWRPDAAGPPVDWRTFPRERERLESFLGANSISGVVLVGVDPCASSHRRTAEPSALAGYCIDDVIVATLDDRRPEAVERKDPSIEWSARLPRVFLALEAKSHPELALVARWIHDDGRGAGREIHRVRWLHSDLCP
ncbi:MAG: alkaline phosphatase D family protein [Planctomycetota bacterium]